MKILTGLVLSLFLFILSNSEKSPINFKNELNNSIKENRYITKIKPQEVVVINIWATWCGPCVREISELNEIVHEYKGKDIRFLAFSNESVDDYKAFKKKHPNFKFEYELSFGDSKTTNLLKKLDQQKGGNSIPLHILIDKDGQVVDVLVGASWTNIRKIKSFLEANIASQ